MNCKPEGNLARRSLPAKFSQFHAAFSMHGHPHLVPLNHLSPTIIAVLPTALVTAADLGVEGGLTSLNGTIAVNDGVARMRID